MKVIVLGGGESGIGSALLAHSRNYDVFLSDGGNININQKELLDHKGIQYEEGGHTFEKFKDADIVIKSPGIPDNIELIQKLNYLKIPVISEIEFGYRHAKGKIIAITGSNGKTTTSLLTYHLLKIAGFDVALGGNIGKSFAGLVAEGDHNYYVLEISSFQLDGIVDFKPDIAVLLNITPDHLDRYEYKFENYINSKFRIIKNMDDSDLFVYSADDQTINKQLLNQSIRCKTIGLKHPFVKNDIFEVKDFAIPLKDLTIKGPHNETNAACAVSIALNLGIDHGIIANGLKSFVNFPHRLEIVKRINGIDFINDSKATNVDATFYGLSAMDRPTIWIVGGTDKGNDYTPLFDVVAEKVKAIVCLGLDNTKIIENFRNRVDAIAETHSAQNAVKTAFSLAKPGDVVLLSPACASFDLFKNYENRGDLFKDAVNELYRSIEN
jgi:UDP-N-acetylmuramoylalanine--D-glutamate ligase